MGFDESEEDIQCQISKTYQPFGFSAFLSHFNENQYGLEKRRTWMFDIRNVVCKNLNLFVKNLKESEKHAFFKKKIIFKRTR